MGNGHVQRDRKHHVTDAEGELNDQQGQDGQGEVTEEGAAGAQQDLGNQRQYQQGHQ